ncbi:polysaccharide deacetylase [Neptunitalea chrysea]|uniref:Polysaccharide deacetylase n=1 Tax=Neptunitalea chrysea TaxID=1647581 RepID=A0A9W6B2B7_9FLAO|nr:polysaccharide deacetylase family protein [Neptunitalea chrysea]GLB50986.1 polysaccharide deacetylase [Neptunitalea chrysea]
MLLVKTPKIIKLLFQKLVWNIPANKKVVYLTFDDGPTKEITEWVLKQLEQYHAKATFFCIGKNITEEPEIFNKIIHAGHAIGNHTYNHLNAWKTNQKNYMNNVLQTEEVIKEYYPEFTENRKLFRPPYGKFTPSLIKRLRKECYTIIAWDIISEDYDTTLTTEKVYNNVVNHVEPGSIIVFHDSKKAFKNLHNVLPKVLEHLSNKGYTFKAI